MAGKHVIPVCSGYIFQGLSNRRNCSDVQLQGQRDITPRHRGNRGDQGQEVDASVTTNSLYHTVIDFVTVRKLFQLLNKVH